MATKTATQTATSTEDMAIKRSFNKTILETNGNAKRVVCYGQPDWLPERDLSLTQYTQASAGLSAIAKHVTGMLAGSPDLLIVAPLEKLGYENGTGAFAFVSDQFNARKGITVKINGESVFLTVKPEDVPTSTGWRRLYLDSGELYSQDWEEVYTRDGKDPWVYWYCKAMKAIMNGYNVSVSVGPKMWERAESIMEVVNSDNPLEADSARRFIDRETRRFQAEVSDQTVDNHENNAKAGKGDLIVSDTNGNPVDIGTWNPRKPIRLQKPSGIGLRALEIKDTSVQGRLAICQVIRAKNALVVAD